MIDARQLWLAVLVEAIADLTTPTCAVTSAVFASDNHEPGCSNGEDSDTTRTYRKKELVRKNLRRPF